MARPKKKPEVDSEMERAPEPAPETESAKPPDDGQAATEAEPVPPARVGKKRGPYKPRAPKSPERDAHALDGNLAAMAAIGPMLAAGAVSAKFFDTALIYDPEMMESAQRLFKVWMEEMGATLHPGVQYGLICGVCIVGGIINSEPISAEQKEQMAKARAESKAAAKAKAEAHAAKANGASAPQVVPQDVPKGPAEAPAPN